MSERRLTKQTERLHRDINLTKRYIDVFKEKLASGIIGEIARDDNGVKGMQINEKNPSKFMVVLNGSVKGKDGVSLNGVLYKGPTMLNKLYNLIIKFRLHSVALTVDIKKAYLGCTKHTDTY